MFFNQQKTTNDTIKTMMEIIDTQNKSISVLNSSIIGLNNKINDQLNIITEIQGQIEALTNIQKSIITKIYESKKPSLKVVSQ